MKSLFLQFSMLFLLIISCKNAPEIQQQQQEPIVSQQISLRNPTQPLVSAHRGGRGVSGYPENALETIKYLHEEGIQIFEIDVFQSADNEIMLLHDDHLERTTTGNGSVKGLNAQELKNIYLVDDFGNKTDFKIPYLKDILQWIKDKDVYLMIDFKKSAKYEDVINLIRQNHVENQCVLISYNIQQAKKLHRLAPEMQLSVSARNQEELDWLLKTDIPTDKMIAFTGTRLSEDALYQRLKELKIPAILGTLGNLDKRAEARGDKMYQKWADLGIQIFATDRPIHAQKALR